LAERVTTRDSEIFSMCGERRAGGLLFPVRGRRNCTLSRAATRQKRRGWRGQTARNTARRVDCPSVGRVLLQGLRRGVQESLRL